MRYFGERLDTCSGCDRCRAEPIARPLPSAALERLTRLRQVMGGRAGPWGACLLEPEVLYRLASDPPKNAAMLADVAGVGPAIAERYGATILGALGGDAPSAAAAERSAAEEALSEWRAAVAREMGVPEYVVLGDRALRQLASGEAGAAERSTGVGPRFRAKFEEEVGRLLQRLRRAGATSPSTPAR